MIRTHGLISRFEATHFFLLVKRCVHVFGEQTRCKKPYNCETNKSVLIWFGFLSTSKCFFLYVVLNETGTMKIPERITFYNEKQNKKKHTNNKYSNFSVIQIRDFIRNVNRMNVQQIISDIKNNLVHYICWHWVKFSKIHHAELANLRNVSFFMFFFSFAFEKWQRMKGREKQNLNPMIGTNLHTDCTSHVIQFHLSPKKKKKQRKFFKSFCSPFQFDICMNCCAK